MGNNPGHHPLPPDSNSFQPLLSVCSFARQLQAGLLAPAQHVLKCYAHLSSRSWGSKDALLFPGDATSATPANGEAHINPYLVKNLFQGHEINKSYKLT